MDFVFVEQQKKNGGVIGIIQQRRASDEEQLRPASQRHARVSQQSEGERGVARIAGHPNREGAHREAAAQGREAPGVSAQREGAGQGRV